MFSGIIQFTAKPLEIQKGTSYTYMFPIPSSWKLDLGESIIIDGICSTVEKLTKTTFSVFYMPETIDKTSLATLSPTHTFNLERSLTLNDLIGGHLVSGHVDTTAKLTEVKKGKDEVTLVFSLPSTFTKYIIYKGSVAINGVSLTVVTVDDTSFSVSLIPFTLSHTNLGILKKGDTVNIEVDMVGKYIEKLFPGR